MASMAGNGTRDDAILVVEDEEPIRELVATALRFRGFRVETAGSGREALAEARNAAYALVVLDVNLPDLDGFEICRKLRSAGDQVPVIFLPPATTRSTCGPGSPAVATTT